MLHTALCSRCEVGHWGTGGESRIGPTNPTTTYDRDAQTLLRLEAKGAKRTRARDPVSSKIHLGPCFIRAFAHPHSGNARCQDHSGPYLCQASSEMDDAKTHPPNDLCIAIGMAMGSGDGEGVPYLTSTTRRLGLSSLVTSKTVLDGTAMAHSTTASKSQIMLSPFTFRGTVGSPSSVCA